MIVAQSAGITVVAAQTAATTVVAAQTAKTNKVLLMKLATMVATTT